MNTYLKYSVYFRFQMCGRSTKAPSCYQDLRFTFWRLHVFSNQASSCWHIAFSKLIVICTFPITSWSERQITIVSTETHYQSFPTFQTGEIHPIVFKPTETGMSTSRGQSTSSSPLLQQPEHFQVQLSTF